MTSGFSVLEYTGDGATDTFAVNFTLGYLKKSDIYCRVGEEVDGSGNPVYRALEDIPGDPGRMRVLGTVPAVGESVLFLRITSKTVLQNDFTDGTSIDDDALNGSFKQTMMIAHELLDGFGLETVYSDINLTGHKITNVTPDVDDLTSVCTVGYVGQAPLHSAAALESQHAAEAAQGLAEDAAAASAASAAAVADTVTDLADDADPAKGAALIGYQGRTVRARLVEIVSVKDHGAVGDGTTDDSAAFTAAFSAADAEVYVPHGTYIVTGLTLTGKKLYGPGTLKWKAASASNMLILAGGASIEGLTFDGNAANQSGTVVGIVTLASPKTRISRCNFTAFRYKVIESDLAASSDCVVEGCIFHDTCTITSGNGVGVRSPRWKIENNSFLTWGADGHMLRLGLLTDDSTSYPVTDTVIRGNVFNGMAVSGSAAIVLTTYTTDTTIEGNSFSSLTQAIKSDSTVTTIKNVSINGNTFRDLTLSTALNIQNDSIVFSGNTVVNCAGPVYVGPNGVISNNILDNVGASTGNLASILQACGTPGCVISGNRISNSPSSGIVCVDGGANIFGNNIKDSVVYGISSTNAKNNITGNVIDGCQWGINIGSTSSGCSILGNVVANASTAEYLFIDNAGFKTCFLDTKSNIGYKRALPYRVIAGGAVDIGLSDVVIAVDTEGAAATDNLDTLSSGVFDGQMVILRSTSASRVITVKDNTGNIQLEGGTDKVLSDSYDLLKLMWRSPVWLEMSFSNNA